MTFNVKFATMFYMEPRVCERCGGNIFGPTDNYVYKGYVNCWYCGTQYFIWSNIEETLNVRTGDYEIKYKYDTVATYGLASTAFYTYFPQSLDIWRMP